VTSAVTIGMGTISRALGTGMSRTLILLGLILVAIGFLCRWISPLRLGRLPGDIVVEHVHSESRHNPRSTIMMVMAVMNIFPPERISDS
jgi:hypothetical protein